MTNRTHSKVLLVGVIVLAFSGATAATLALDPLNTAPPKKDCMNHEHQNPSKMMGHEACTPSMDHPTKSNSAIGSEAMLEELELEPVLLFEIVDRSFTKTDSYEESYEGNFRVQDEIWKLEETLSYQGIGKLWLRLVAPDGSQVLSFEQEVLPTSHDHSGHKHEEKWRQENLLPGLYSLQIGVVGQFTVSMRVMGEPCHMEDHENHAEH